jgi:hypothetical protein
MKSKIIKTIKKLFTKVWPLIMERAVVDKYTDMDKYHRQPNVTVACLCLSVTGWIRATVSDLCNN